MNKKRKMKSNYKPIGDYIRDVNNRNEGLKSTNLLGINISNNFMPSVANRAGLDLSRYKLIEEGQFATNIMHVGRDRRLPIALYTDNEPSIVSPAYKTFEVIDKDKLLPEYLMIEFERSEFHRLTWYYCDSSVRGGLDWDRFKDIQIPIPSIEEQRKYVAVYKGLLANQKCYESSFDDLFGVCVMYMDSLKTLDNKKPIKDLVQLIDNRNREGEINNLQGINIDKVFMPSKANVAKSNLSNYKIIKKNQFAYSSMQVGRDKTVRVVLYPENGPAIISPAYSVFEVINTDVVLPEFLMLWFYRPEFNRLGWFYSDSSVRASLEWNRFSEISIPIPSIEIQKAIVTIYHTLETRKTINEKLKDSIKPLCPVLMRGVVGEMESVILK